MKIVLLLLFCLIGALFFLRHISLFISQYYNEQRYLMSLLQEYKKRLKKHFYICFFPLLTLLSFFLKLKYVSSFILAAWLIYYFISPSYMPFKKTRRSLTLFFFSLFLWGVIVFCLPIGGKIILASCLPIWIPLFLMIANIMLMPNEGAIRYHYIKKAKRKIKRCRNLKVIAITGSYGKSSFKYFLYQFLRNRYAVIMTPKSINTQMGITKFINENLQESTEIMILEFGVDEKGGMDRLFFVVTPDIGILTAIGKMHLKTFHSLENIFHEKKKLILKVKKGYYSKDSIYLKSKEAELEKCDGYSYHDIFFKAQRNENGLEVEFNKEEIVIPLYGMFQLSNISGAIKVAMDLGVSKKEIRQILPSLEGVEHRFQKRKEENLLIFDDAYNGNEEGILEDIQTVLLQKGKKAIITPGVIELGEEYEKVNKNIGAHLIDFDRVYIVSKEKKHPLLDGYLACGGEKSHVEFVSSFIDGYRKCKEEKMQILLIANDTFSTFLK